MLLQHSSTQQALTATRFIGTCRACERPLFENSRVLLRGQLLYCECCGGPAQGPRTLGDLWRCFVHWFLR